MKIDSDIIDVLLLQWISDLQEGDLSESDQKLLNQLLQESAEARAFYSKMMSLHMLLNNHYSDQTQTDSDSQLLATLHKKKQKYKWQPNLINIAAIAASVLFVFCSYLIWQGYQVSLDRGIIVEQSSQKNRNQGVAILTQSIGAHWKNSLGDIYGKGAVLPAGDFHLNEGFAQIELLSGAVITLESPSELTLISDNKIKMAHGKLRAYVPETAQGFIVESPKFDTVDLGTEFAMQLDKEGYGEVHVMSGEVSLHQKNGDLIQHLAQGNSIKITELQSFERIENSEYSFIDRKNILEMAKQEELKVAGDWEKQRAQLISDPDVVVYFDFQEDQLWKRQLKNAKSNMPNGSIIGAQWSEGRWLGKGALNFKNIKNRVRVNVPGEFEAITFSIFVKVDGFANRFNSLFMTDQHELHKPQLHIGENGNFNFSIRNVGAVVSPKAIKAEDVGNWVHLVATYDSHDQRMALYCNGKLMATSKTAVVDYITLGNSEIGNWKSNVRKITELNYRHAIRSLNGVMDEFIIFKRALAESEVADLYFNQYYQH